MAYSPGQSPVSPSTPDKQFDAESHYQRYLEAQKNNQPTSVTIKTFVDELQKEQAIRRRRDKYIWNYADPLNKLTSPPGYSRIEEAENEHAKHERSLESLSTSFESFASMMNNATVDETIKARWEAFSTEMASCLGTEGSLTTTENTGRDHLRRELEEVVEKMVYWEDDARRQRRLNEKVEKQLKKSLEVDNQNVYDRHVVPTDATMRAAIEGGLDDLQELIRKGTKSGQSEKNSVSGGEQNILALDMPTLIIRFNNALVEVQSLVDKGAFQSENSDSDEATAAEIESLKTQLIEVQDREHELGRQIGSLRTANSTLQTQLRNHQRHNNDRSRDEYLADRLDTLDDEEIGALQDLADSFQQSAGTLGRLLEDCEEHRAKVEHQVNVPLLRVLHDLSDRTEREQEQYTNYYGQRSSTITRKLNFIWTLTILLADKSPSRKAAEDLYSIQEGTIQQLEQALNSLPEIPNHENQEDTTRGVEQRIDRLTNARDEERATNPESEDTEVADVLYFFNRLSEAMTTRNCSISSFIEDYIRVEYRGKDNLQQEINKLRQDLRRCKRKKKRTKSDSLPNPGDDGDDDDNDNHGGNSKKTQSVQQDPESQAHKDDNMAALRHRQAIGSEDDEGTQQILKNFIDAIEDGNSFFAIALIEAQQAVKTLAGIKKKDEMLNFYENLWHSYASMGINLSKDRDQLVANHTDQREMRTLERNNETLMEEAKEHAARIKIMQQELNAVRKKEEDCRRKKADMQERIETLEARIMLNLPKGVDPNEVLDADESGVTQNDQSPFDHDAKAEELRLAQEQNNTLQAQIEGLNARIQKITAANSGYVSLTRGLIQQGREVYQQVIEIEDLDANFPQWVDNDLTPLNEAVQVLITNRNRLLEEINELQRDVEDALGELNEAQEDLQQSRTNVTNLEHNLSNCWDETWEQRRARVESDNAEQAQGNVEDSEESDTDNDTPSDDSEDDDNDNDNNDSSGGAINDEGEDNDEFDIDSYTFEPAFGNDSSFDDEASNEAHEGGDGDSSSTGKGTKRRGRKREEPCLRQHREQREGGWHGAQFSPPSARALGLTGLEIGGNFLEIQSFVGEDDGQKTPRSIRKRRGGDVTPTQEETSPEPRTTATSKVGSSKRKIEELDVKQEEQDVDVPSESDNGRKKRKTTNRKTPARRKARA